MTKKEIEILASSIGNIHGSLGLTCPNNIKNPGFYFGALLALQTIFPQSLQDINEIIEARKKQFADKSAQVEDLKNE